jgi:hypothetical protein
MENNGLRIRPDGRMLLDLAYQSRGVIAAFFGIVLAMAGILFLIIWICLEFCDDINETFIGISKSDQYVRSE